MKKSYFVSIMQDRVDAVGVDKLNELVGQEFQLMETHYGRDFYSQDYILVIELTKEEARSMRGSIVSLLNSKHYRSDCTSAIAFRLMNKAIAESLSRMKVIGK